MFKFLKDNASVISKLFVYQFALTVFGLLLFTVSQFAESDAIVAGISAFSVLFYLFIIYTNMWDIGAKDKIRIEGKRLQSRPLHGIWVGIAANIPNYILAIASTVGYLFIDHSVKNADGKLTTPEWAVNLYGIAHAIGSYLNGTFLGITSTLKIDVLPFTLFIITVPSIAACALGYYFGTKEKFPIIAEKHNVDY